MELNSNSGPTPTVRLHAEAVWWELEEVLKSPGFARNERLSRFLRFVVQLHLEGRDTELKESVIGIEVFGRRADYNPKDDPIVRTEARRLRDRLGKYYEGCGAADAVVIELPKGGYVPLVRQVPKLLQATEPLRSRSTEWRWAALALVGLATVLAAVGWMWLAAPGGLQYRTNPEAYDLYRRARAFTILPSLSGIESSIDLFHQAIVKDPSFAPAYAGVAAGYAGRSGFDGFTAIDRANMLAQGWAAAEKATLLDPLSADAHDAMGMMQARQAQWGPAERSFRRAIELAPRDVVWQDHFAMFFLLPLGRIEEAVRHLRIAEGIDPLSPQTHIALSWALKAAGRFDEAHFHCQKAAQNDRQRSVCWGEVLLRQGKNKEAVRTLEAVWSEHLLEPGGHVLGVAYAKVGRVADAERIAAILPRLASKAQIFAALRDKDRTFEVLNRMVPMGPARIGRDFLISPNFAFLRGDPRLKALRRSVGLPE
jgi:Flp pilus assembly protein TadD